MPQVMSPQYKLSTVSHGRSSPCRETRKDHVQLSQNVMVQTWKEMGFKSLDDFLVNFWEKFFLARDANNLLCMLSTWTNGNIGDTKGFDGDVEEALASIQVGGIAWLHACLHSGKDQIRCACLLFDMQWQEEEELYRSHPLLNQGSRHRVTCAGQGHCDASGDRPVFSSG